MITRREFGRLAVAGLVVARPEGRALLASATGADSAVNGVHLGVQTYSFRDLPRPSGAPDSVDVVIKAMQEAGVSECELFAPQLEPQFPQGARGQRGAPPSPEAVKAREDLRKWRLETSLDHFKNAKKKFDAAGIAITAYCYNMNDSFTDAEIDRGFEMTKALGTSVMTTSTQMTVAKRIAPLADKHKVLVGLHGHSNISDPNEYATPESFAAAMKMSKYFKVNLDIGHFTAANFDSVEYIRENHDRITHLHVKDRKKNQGPNVPWGEGDTPIKQVLVLLKEKKYPIPALVEYEHGGQGTPIEEVKKCMTYMRQALA